MIALAEWVLAFAWTFGSNGHLLAQPFMGEDGLPASWLRPISTQSRVIFHDRAEWSMAFYVAPPSGSGSDSALGAGPRVFLFAPYYLAPNGLVDANQMSVDVAEYYFHALLDGRLDLEVRRPDSSYREVVASRAGELMGDVPERFRQAAYLSAVSDFGAHLMSIANEIVRAFRRQSAVGRDLCQLIDQPSSLFGLWTRSFRDGAYTGRYLDTGEANAGERPRWEESQEPLTVGDKKMLVQEILKASWSGDAAQDFAWLCPLAKRSIPDSDSADAG